MAEETLTPYPKELSLPSKKEIIDSVQRLQGRIEEAGLYGTRHVDVPGEGEGRGLSVDFPDGSQRNLVWVEKGSGTGILAWSENEEDEKSIFRRGNRFNLIYVDPNKSLVEIGGAIRNKSYPGASPLPKFVDLDDLGMLLSLAQQPEEA